MAKDFRDRVAALIPGTTARRTERTQTIYVRLPDGTERMFTRVDDCIAWATTYGMPPVVETQVLSPYMVEVTAWLATQL